MIVAGVDIGSAGAKALIMRDENHIDWSITPTTGDSSESAEKVMNMVLRKTCLTMADIDYIVSTGYGRVNVEFAKKTVTEISCHAAGANWIFPQVRTILDVGGQDVKAIRCNENGKVVSFLLNDRCSAGTGRYLEWTAATFNLRIDEIGPLALSSKLDPPLLIESQCTVFAREDMINWLRRGKNTNDILAGSLRTLAKRLCAFLNRLGGVEESLVISGGVGKNIALVTYIEQELGLKTLTPPEPQILGALGAAVFAKREMEKQLVKNNSSQ